MSTEYDFTPELLDEMKRFRFRLHTQIVKNKQRATGKTQSALRERTPEPGVAQLLGPFYIYSLDKGVRRSTKYTKPGLAFVAKIKEWLKARSLAASPWAVATNILKKGTLLNRTGRTFSGVGRDETIAGVINAESLGSLRARLATAASRNVRSDMLENLKFPK